MCVLQEEKLLNYVFAEAKEGDITSVIDTIDKFCNAENGWMMNGQSLTVALTDTRRDTHHTQLMEDKSFLTHPWSHK